MNYLIFDNPEDARGLSHEAYNRCYPLNPAPDNGTGSTIYLNSVKVHPTTGEAAIEILDGDEAYYDESYAADFVPSLDASWEVAE